MSDTPKKYAEFLDQLLPFLYTAPDWFKIWIYVLIFLILATAALAGIFYLQAKDRGHFRQSWEAFSVENPKANAEIPLGGTQSWMLEGTLPLFEKDDLRKTANVKVEVYKLPDRNKIEQTGTPRLSTAEGRWSYESATFSGNGSYEIVVTAVAGNDSTFRRLQVNCIDKASALTAAIQVDREKRGATRLETPRLTAEPPELAYARLEDKQTAFFDQYPKNLDAAQKIVSESLDILDRVLPSRPDDLWLQAMRAYMFKNYAMIMRDKGNAAEFDRALDESQKMFELIRQQDAKDASAWNGLGSVEALRGNYRTALFYIDRALELKPDYADALHDRREIERVMRQGEKKP
jgi:tetratricopeptide (TPR) repeat protein